MIFWVLILFIVYVHHKGRLPVYLALAGISPLGGNVKEERKEEKPTPEVITL